MFAEMIDRLGEQLKPIERQEIPRFLKEMQAFLQGADIESRGVGELSN
jgi:hypothetical protein